MNNLNSTIGKTYVKPNLVFNYKLGKKTYPFRVKTGTDLESVKEACLMAIVTGSKGAHVGNYQSNGTVIRKASVRRHR